jgi:hypothetical protein
MIILVILEDIVLSAFRTQGSEVSKKLQLLDMPIFLESVWFFSSVPKQSYST